MNPNKHNPRLQFQVQEMILESEKYREEDEKRVKDIEGRNTLETFIYHMRSSLDHPGVVLEDGDKETLSKKCDDSIR